VRFCIDAWLKVHPNELNEALQLLSAFDEPLSENAVGSIGEIFAAEAPCTHRGVWHKPGASLKFYARMQKSQQ
jgi:hypothetical protein